ncbi:MAG: sulfatase-like hydrolase/transferase, partial [Planctomycetes bacterium]|nr:sulfatase-like hydrolase/transferase [Planctomycetota bacterium]
MADKPNILLITADQFRWDCLASMGNGAIQTPNLDAIAARGVLFRNGYSPNPICVPARACIMTGNYPQICTGRKSNSGRIKDDQPLLTEVLKGVGYRTYALGKLHFVPYAPPGEPRLVHGFEHVDLHESGRIINQYDPQGEREGLEDYFDYLKTVGWGGYTRAHGVGNNDVRPCPSPLPQEHHVDHWIADCTIKQMKRHAAESPDKPFFMWMSSPKPHSPYDPPRPYDAMYDPRTIPAPFGSLADLADRNPRLDQTRYTHAIPTLSKQAWQVIRSYYYGCISFLDAMIGRVITHLEETGRLDNTLILFTADHGDLLGDFGSCFKANQLNGSVRVPYLMAGPGVTNGAVSDALVGLQDVLPTFAAAAGADIGQEVQGLDLSAHLADTSVPVRDVFYSTTLESPAQTAMVTDGRMKYIYSEGNATEELYDQENDLAEEHNLAADDAYKKKLAAMRDT